MSRITDRAREIWLFLLTQGGWWSVAELLAQRPDWRTPRHSIGHALRGFYQHGTCQRRLPKGSIHYEYAITPECFVAQGVRVVEVLEAVH